FFQAEDGIRDFHVTGVQTCALPIWRGRRQSQGQRYGGGGAGIHGWGGRRGPGDGEPERQPGAVDDRCGAGRVTLCRLPGDSHATRRPRLSASGRGGHMGRWRGGGCKRGDHNALSRLRIEAGLRQPLNVPAEVTMKTAGLIGGMSWESTQTYYRLINQGVKQRLGGLHSARLVLYSVDFAEIEALQHQGDWAATARILSEAARSVEAAGAEFLVLC